MLFIDLITPEFLAKVEKLKQQKSDYEQGIDSDDAPFFIRNMYFQAELSKELGRCYTLIGEVLENNEIAFFQVEKQLDKQDIRWIKEYCKKRVLKEKLKKKNDKMERMRARSFAQMQKYLEKSGISIEQIEKTNTLMGTSMDSFIDHGIKLETLRKQSQ